ncbi:MAG: terminase, partial [Acidimicrobiia bacterium]
GEDLDDPAQLAAAIRAASGPAVMGWDDSAGQVEAIASLYQQAKRRGGVAYFERVWLNRRTQAARQAFDAALWAGLARERPRMDRRSPVVLGFDGSRWRDVTSLVLTHVPTGWQQVLGAWQRGGADPEDWEVPRDEVEALVDDVFATRVVLRLYGDPAEGWADMLAALASRHGPKRVFEFYTDSRNLRKTAYAVRKFYEAIRAGEVGHDGDAEYAAHIGHARRRDTHMRDDDGHPLWVLEKERHDSPFKIDHAMAGVLSWQARLDVITAGQDRGPERAYAYSA